MKYLNRSEAGKVLAQQLKQYVNRDDVLVLALPRGGVPVAFEIASALHAKLDVFIVRKLGVPGHVELAMGAIAMGNVVVLNEEIVKDLMISPAAINAVMAKEQQELQRRTRIFRGDIDLPKIKDQIVILVDDGIATGATMRAAIKALQQLNPARIIAAVPVADDSTCTQIESLVDKLICPLRPTSLCAVGAWYEDFSQTEDDEVHTLLNAARKMNMKNFTP